MLFIFAIIAVFSYLLPIFNKVDPLPIELTTLNPQYDLVFNDFEDEEVISMFAYNDTSLALEANESWEFEYNLLLDYETNNTWGQYVTFEINQYKVTTIDEQIDRQLVHTILCNAAGLINNPTAWAETNNKPIVRYAFDKWFDFDNEEFLTSEDHIITDDIFAYPLEDYANTYSLLYTPIWYEALAPWVNSAWGDNNNFDMNYYWRDTYGLTLNYGFALPQYIAPHIDYLITSGMQELKTTVDNYTFYDFYNTFNTRVESVVNYGPIENVKLVFNVEAVLNQAALTGGQYQ